MSLIERIDQDLKEAMKAKNEAVLSALRLVRSALKNKQIDLGRELTDEDTLGIMRTIVKQYKDALSDFEGAGRTDLATKQKSEIELIERYLPAPLGEAEIEVFAKKIIAETNATSKDVGRVMGMVMKLCDGRADGNVVRTIVQKLLT